MIIHAGDIGNIEIIDQLKLIAPVRAIRGNIDKGSWIEYFPINDAFEFAGKFFYVLHNLHEIDLDPAAAQFEVVVSGHSHMPKIENKKGVLYINPGSAGPRRFKLPVSLAKLRILEDVIKPEILTLIV